MHVTSFQDAALICSAYDASLVEFSEGREPTMNNFVKSKWKIRAILRKKKNYPKTLSFIFSLDLIHEASDEGAWFDPGPRFDKQQ